MPLSYTTSKGSQTSRTCCWILCWKVEQEQFCQPRPVLFNPHHKRACAGNRSISNEKQVQTDPLCRSTITKNGEGQQGDEQDGNGSDVWTNPESWLCLSKFSLLVYQISFKIMIEFVKNRTFSLLTIRLHFVYISRIRWRFFAESRDTFLNIPAYLSRIQNAVTRNWKMKFDQTYCRIGPCCSYFKQTNTYS